MRDIVTLSYKESIIKNDTKNKQLLYQLSPKQSNIILRKYSLDSNSEVKEEAIEQTERQCYNLLDTKDERCSQEKNEYPKYTVEQKELECKQWEDKKRLVKQTQEEIKDLLKRINSSNGNMEGVQKEKNSTVIENQVQPQLIQQSNNLDPTQNQDTTAKFNSANEQSYGGVQGKINYTFCEKSFYSDQQQNQTSQSIITSEKGLMPSDIELNFTNDYNIQQSMVSGSNLYQKKQYQSAPVIKSDSHELLNKSILDKFSTNCHAK